ncbi:DMP19 family protein [Pseudomonas sp. DTU_2021_1001937_2_SI_NGA_ILE_001]|uniref:DMP19 family protein n=1 Tax=Pseudomonas sp. DTU_2021_1001937_2_SI_NGA_ILE_001 TaxID=3077589 RepID=UPI0028FC2B2A|nr:DMP19 family protein [Pseudomonas sp. DTU_2021_1001937_2_SI_NGA_ILE_001]WNW10053.1 DMP19 family protein [Pseudomonas sp. DTU_2021_1001937_2_SI_NGA_ILE_001]
MSEKIPCRACGNLILPSTAERTQGLCMPCKGGYRENIENGKRFAEERKHYLASPQARYWSALVARVYDGAQGFAGLKPPEQLYYVVSVLVGEVYNGGFDQYFGNSSGDHYQQTCEGLAELGATRTLALLQEARRQLFGDAPVPTDQGERQLQMPTYRDTPDSACEAALDALDRRFYADDEHLAERLYQYALQHRLFTASEA